MSGLLQKNNLHWDWNIVIGEIEVYEGWLPITFHWKRVIDELQVNIERKDFTIPLDLFEVPKTFHIQKLNQNIFWINFTILLMIVSEMW